MEQGNCSDSTRASARPIALDAVPDPHRDDRIAAVLIAPAPEPDPIFAAIAEAWRLTREFERLHGVAGSLPGEDPAWGPTNEAHTAMWSHIDTVLLRTVPRTAQGCQALSRFALAFTADQGVPVARGDETNNAILSLIAGSPLTLDTTTPSAGNRVLPDIPTDLAEACAWAIARKAWIDEGQNFTDAELTVELSHIDTVFLRAVTEPSRTPTDLAAKARLLLDDHNILDDLDPKFADQRLLPVVLREAVEFGSSNVPARGDPTVPDRPLAVGESRPIDLSGVPITRLLNLYDRFSAAADFWLDTSNAPFCSTNAPSPFRQASSAGVIVDHEQDRAARIRDQAAREIERRTPTDDFERNHQLEVLVRHELACNGDLRDPAIRLRIADTWGAR